jgi:hypothetical protein
MSVQHVAVGRVHKDLFIFITQTFNEHIREHIVCVQQTNEGNKLTFFFKLTAKLCLQNEILKNEAQHVIF